MGNKFANAIRTAANTRESEQWHVPPGWRASGYLATLAPWILVVGLAWSRPDWNRGEIPDWRPVFASAAAALQRGDLYEARHLYMQTERIASWRHDWSGLVASACGFRRLDSQGGPYSKTFSILVRALTAAESVRSRAGVAVVAHAFAALGEPKASSLSLSRIRRDWPVDSETSHESFMEGCRTVSVNE
jgi:hypothetical protein